MGDGSSNILNKDSLKDIYKLNDLKSSFDEFDILIKEVKYKKQGSDVLVSFTKATITGNSLEEGVYL